VPGWVGVSLTQADFMRRLLGSRNPQARQRGLGLLAAIVLLLGWEGRKR
jgi:hypothetical protein